VLYDLCFVVFWPSLTVDFTALLNVVKFSVVVMADVSKDLLPLSSGYGVNRLEGND